MKKINFKLLLIFALTFTMFSCEDEFLNDPQPTASVTDAVIFGSRTGADAFVSGIMRRFRGQFTATDAAGVNSIYYARTVKGNDVIQRATWFTFDYENDNREPTYRRVNFSWNYPFYMINQANNLINGAAAAEALSDVDKSEIIGQGRAIRAFFYFQLAMEFQHTYTYDPTLPAPPIYTELSTEGKPMSTLQEMYDLIIEDLTYATQNLSSSRLGKSYINQNAAYGILARVYQTTGNWQGAEDAARRAYGGGTPASILNQNYANGFNDISDSEWIWGSAQSLDQSNYYWGAPHAHTDHFVLSYAATHFNTDFVNLFSPTDIRNTFVDGYGVGDPTNWRNWISRKFTFNFDSDHPIIRTAEMLLVEAEAKYYNGDQTGAHNLLFNLQSNRDPLATKSSNTGQALLEEILVERRKELYAEIGVEWFDAKRYRTGITRTGNHRLINSGLTADDTKFFLKIPQAEMDANENIDESVNANR
jgi:hypothetical protein